MQYSSTELEVDIAISKNHSSNHMSIKAPDEIYLGDMRVNICAQFHGKICNLFAKNSCISKDDVIRAMSRLKNKSTPDPDPDNLVHFSF